MKAIVKWIGRILATVISFLLIIQLMPYARTLADYLLPDISGSHIKTSAILSQQMQEQAFLVTSTVTGEGVLSAERPAAFIGTVSELNVSYSYTGSFGIDLSKVEMRIRGNEVVFILPQPECLSDSSEMLEVHRSGSFDSAVEFSDMELQELREKAEQKCREQYLTGDKAQELRDVSEKVFNDTISAWMSEANSRLTYSYEWAAPITE